MKTALIFLGWGLGAITEVGGYLTGHAGVIIVGGILTIIISTVALEYQH